VSTSSGTDGSNPAPSSKESVRTRLRGAAALTLFARHQPAEPKAWPHPDLEMIVDTDLATLSLGVFVRVGGSATVRRSPTGALPATAFGFDRSVEGYASAGLSRSRVSGARRRRTPDASKTALARAAATGRIELSLPPAGAGESSQRGSGGRYGWIADLRQSRGARLSRTDSIQHHRPPTETA
jgi:hypothetical protein